MRVTNTLSEAVATTKRSGVAKMRRTNTLSDNAALTERRVPVSDAIFEIIGMTMLPVTSGLTETCQPGDVRGVVESGAAKYFLKLEDRPTNKTQDILTRSLG